MDQQPPAGSRLDLGRYGGRIIASREIPPREGRFCDIPPSCHPALRQALHDAGFGTLYSHQAETFTRALAGENVVLTTGTASGKSLAYLLPILQSVLEDPTSRAILLFPTKALGQDQLRGLLRYVEYFGSHKLEAGVYDGDTPPDERSRIREQANLILTNPDMLNSAFIPNHGRRGFSHIFRNLRYLVVDELHTYRGAFGAHFANLMRRLRRICRHYGSDPRMLCSSATIANPRELAETLLGRPFTLIDEDGSPSAGKVIHFWQPPLLDNGMRRGVVQEMAGLVPLLVGRRHRFIAFCRSRKETEVVLKESRDALSHVDGGHDESQLVAGYRGGYTPEERRRVARELIEGKLLGVVSTNALELGVDIGALEIAVQAGFPGSRASFWQQSGRAGRRGTLAHAIVILAMTPLDQFIGLDPEWLVSTKAEHAVVDPDNLMIQLAHIRAAAAELPLNLDDQALFPDLGEVVPVLQAAGELKEVYGAFHWTGGPYPAGDFSLRNVDGDRFKIVNRLTGSTITEMDRPQTYEEAHPRAVYLHDGIQHLVEELDLVGRVATVVPVEQDYYTQPDVRAKIDVLLTQGTRAVGRSQAFFGDVRVDRTVVGYKMLQFHNHQNLGYEVLDPPLALQLETEAVWLSLPEEVLAALAGEPHDLLRGMVHAVLSCARMKTMAERQDLGGTSFHYTEEQSGRTSTALILHDNHPGGLGYAARAFEHVEEVLQAARTLVERCSCKDGCPACIGDYLMDRALVAWGLQSLFEQRPLPDGARQRPRPPALPPGQAPIKAFSWSELPARWPEIAEFLHRTGEFGTEMLAGVTRVTTIGPRLVLHVDSPGLAAWIGEELNNKRLKNLLAAHLALPEVFQVEGRVSEQGRERAAAITHKLRRRYDDLTKKA